MVQKTKLKTNQGNQFNPDLMGSDVNVIHEITSSNIFRSLDLNGSGTILKKDLIEALESRGILMTDPRIQGTYNKLKKFKDTEGINPKVFHETIVDNITLIEKALKGDLIIPDFASFSSLLSDIFEETLF